MIVGTLSPAIKRWGAAGKEAMRIGKPSCPEVT
jgi:hypothetical protein